MSDNDDEFCIPRSAMYKLVKELVPQVRLSGEAKDLIVTACNEFIHLLATEANQVCEKQSKKLILPDHVLLALDNLGFGEYKEDCIEVMKQMQEEVDKRKKLRNRLEKPGIPEEELLRQQNQLFAEARKQQQMIENAEEWTRVQQEAQLALQRQASTSSNNNDHLVYSNNNNQASVTAAAATANNHTTSNNKLNSFNVNSNNANTPTTTTSTSAFNATANVNINNNQFKNGTNANVGHKDEDDDDDNYD
jgi:histone H3/H4